MTPTLFHHIGLQVCYHPASDILRPPIFFLASGTKFPMFPTGLSKRFLLHYWRGRFLNPAVSAACTRGEIDGQILQQEKYILIGLFFPVFYLFSLRAIYQLQRVTFQTTLHQTKTSDKITFYSKYDAWCVSLRVCVCVDSAAGCGKSFTTRVSKLHFTLQMELNSHEQICFFWLHTSDRTFKLPK